jgi:hypothetical protein
MKIQLPKHVLYSRVQLVVTTPQGRQRMVFGAEHQIAEFDLPDSVGENEVKVECQYLDGGSRPVGDPMVMRHPQPAERGPKKWEDLSVKERAYAITDVMVNPDPEPEMNDEKDPESVDPEVGEDVVEDAPIESDGVVEETPEPPAQKVKKPRRRRSH